MIRNYFLIAFRNFRRNKLFLAIYVFGLSIGISASVVIFILVRHELSFDRFQPDRERIYRVVMDFKFGEISGHGAAVPAPLATAVTTEVTGVDAVAPIMKFQGDAKVQVTVSGDVYPRPSVFKKQSGVVFTTVDYFDLVPHEFIAGDPLKALGDPFNVVLTESRARQYFPGKDLTHIIGKQLDYNDKINVTVSAVVKDLTENTDLQAMEFISYNTIAKTNLQENFMMTVWDDWMAYSSLYVKLSPSNDRYGVERQLAGIHKKYRKEDPDRNNSAAYKLQPLADIHFNPDYIGFDQRIAHKPTLYSLLAIAGFILLLACINFTNLTTAQAAQRAKEIGIRKTIGSSRKQLIYQFLCETFCVTTLAAVVSISITPILMGLFAEFLPPGINHNPSSEPLFMGFLLCLVLVVSFMSGFYPAFVLSKFRPIAVLKDRIYSGSQTRTGHIRRVLTVTQFIIAQFFVIAAFMVGKQIHYSMNQDLGFRKDAIITFETPFRDDADHRELLVSKIKSIQGVDQVTTGFLPPSMQGAAFNNVKLNDGTEPIDLQVQIRFGEPEFISLYGIEIMTGRNIQPGENINEMLINQKCARDLGFVNVREIIGRQLLVGNGQNLTVVGVMQDFHEGSFHLRKGPLIFTSRPGSFVHLSLINDASSRQHWPEVINKIRQSYMDIVPDGDFNYSFVDDTIAGFYERERNMAKLLNWSTVISIAISCLGLLGLVVYTSETRTKEIGIRKIFGATVSSIVTLLSMDFFRLILIAFFISGPLAWWAVDNWLNGFAYRTSMSWWVFAGSAGGLIIFAVATLAGQLIKTATQSPVKSLRSE
ncbi:MAG TPA: ABC transporter permease [Chryseolinea sp.]